MLWTDSIGHNNHIISGVSYGLSGLTHFSIQGILAILTSIPNPQHSVTGWQPDARGRVSERARKSTHGSLHRDRTLDYDTALAEKTPA
jgi:hypothetical protein